ncbi:4Fe-4S dicluster domain-containing protein [Streptomyces sp. FH025]|uniref:4Fe-4S dicluster domain-containing protein n=1 Tax=Streptomyces sp. FH025 TaxID=2815937 RepID=UPI001A9E56C4|nr:4Fe-4S dicluster domain-containing protein [Streptomyces sp. FH025]MBO1414081.1 4Fe-4S dicluster domain-containing protein [Streptomyces sp. FH025]
METTTAPLAELDREGLAALVEDLRQRGFTVIGPTVRGDAIVLAELASAQELPYGWGVETEAGRYRLRRREDGAAFAHSAGPQSWKTFLHPPRARLWQADRSEDGTVTVREDDEPPPRYAFLGVRPCDLRAIAVQDRVLTGGAHVDPVYGRRRSGAFLVVAECTEPGGVCFCASMGTGPGLPPGAPPYDLALTETVEPDGPHYVVRAGSPEGEEVLAGLPTRPTDGERARAAVAEAAGRMGREMDATDLRSLMAGTMTAERWDQVANRCLTCGNCTMVCPTCFCTTTEEVTDLTGDHAERWRRWDSCFDLDFSYLHGTGPVRSSARSRYRQWLTHKVGTWHDQFGESGCVGCGRCIAWCPVGIDITEEVAALRAESAPPEGAP